MKPGPANFRRITLLGLILWGLLPLKAQEQLLSQAQELLNAKNYTQALYVYNQVITDDPHNLEALRNRAIVLSWSQQYKRASLQFDQILKSAPHDIQTLNAAAYNMAWWGNYVRAESLFRRCIIRDPDNQEAWKGLAYLALWKGHGKLAINRFTRLMTQEQAPADVTIGLGHAYLLAGQHKKARALFDKALLSTSQQSAEELLKAVQSSPGWLEINIWGGYAQFDDQQSWGLRSAEVAYQPHNQLRFWARYDNSLTLENLALIRSRAQANGYFVGAFHQWSRYFLTKVELGYRDMDESITSDHKLIQIEQQVFLRNHMVLKGGFFATDGSVNDDAWTGYAGIGFPMSKRWTLEPVYYFTQSGLTRLVEHRAQLNSYLTLPKAHQINLGLFGGRLGDAELDNRNLYGGLISWVIPTAKRHWATLMIRYESGVDDLLVASAGFRYRLER